MNRGELSEQLPSTELTAPISASTADAIPAPAPSHAPGEPLAASPITEATVAPPSKRRGRRALLGRRLKGHPLGIHVRVHTLDSLRYRNFRLMWASTIFLSGAFWVQELVIGWLTYHLTQDPLLTSLALGLVTLPYLLAAPVGGLLADLLDRRKFLVANLAYQAAITAGFATVVALDLTETWHIFAFIVAVGLSWAISDPTRFAIVANTVPRQNLLNAFALNGLAFNATRLVVPAVAGLLIALLGPGPTLLLASVLYLGAAVATIVMDLPRMDRQETPRRKLLAQLVEAATFVRKEPLVLALILLGGIPLLLILPFVQGLLPVYASKVFEVGPAGLGLMMSALGLGATIGTFILASLGDIAYKGRVLLLGLGLTAAAMMAFSHSPGVAPPLLILAIFAGSLTMYFAIGGAALQAIVPDSLRGRVSSISIMTWGLIPLGSLLSGGLARLLGAPSTTLIAGAAVAVLLAVVSPKLRRVWNLK